MYLQNPPFGGFHFDTLYFGGGTPSVYDASDLKKIISRITPYLSQNVELTCEVNPATLSREQLARYRDIGINRLSIGVQSFHDQELAFLGRIHRAAEAEQFIQHVKSSGFENWGIDLIFGIPGQTIDSWRDSLRRTLALAPKHISLYGLTVEEGTPLASAVHSRRVRLCHEESERHMYLLALELLGKAGYEHYEISNFSLPGFRSRHNQKYWNGIPYLGMGPSAHSFNGEKRWWNKATVRGYIEDINQFLLPVEAREILTDSQQLDEFLLLGLRQYEGIPLELFQSKFPRASALNNNIGYDHDVPPFAPSPSGKLLTIFKHHLCLTQQGLLLYNTVCENLTANIKIV